LKVYTRKKQMSRNIAKKKTKKKKKIEGEYGDRFKVGANCRPEVGNVGDILATGRKWTFLFTETDRRERAATEPSA